jgi:DNA-binding transcriptional MerR regulator
LSRSYRINEFAQRAGTTVKALYLYDRLGLVKPGRTASGYRIYTDRDLGRLEQIAALKFLGIPLKQMKPALSDVLRQRRAVLEEQQRRIGRAIRGIQDAERDLEAGKPPSPAVWRKIMEAIDGRNDISVMKSYYSEGAWGKRKHHYENWPSPELQEIYRDLIAAQGEDPGGVTLQAIKARMLNLLNLRVTGDPEVQAGAWEAWKDRAHWPLLLYEKVQQFQIEKAVEILALAMAANWKRFTASEAWTRLEERQRNPTEPWNQWYVRMREALEEDPPGEKLHAIVVRMTEL